MQLFVKDLTVIDFPIYAQSAAWWGRVGLSMFCLRAD